VLKDVFLSSEEKIARKKDIEKQITRSIVAWNHLEYKFLNDLISQESFNSLFKNLNDQQKDSYGKHVTLSILSQTSTFNDENN